MQRVWWIPAALAAIGGIFKFCTWYTTPNIVYTQVQAIQWTYVAHLRERQIKHESGWGSPDDENGFYNEPPFNTNCRQKYYGMEDCNSHPCWNDRTKTCYDQCEEYRKWCEYDYWDWPIRRSEETSGTDHSPFWPNISIEDSERQRIQRIQKFTVVFNRSEFLSYSPKTIHEFRGFHVGDHYNVRIGRFRTDHVESYQKITAEKQ